MFFHLLCVSKTPQKHLFHQLTRCPHFEINPSRINNIVARTTWCVIPVRRVTHVLERHFAALSATSEESLHRCQCFPFCGYIDMRISRSLSSSARMLFSTTVLRTSESNFSVVCPWKIVHSNTTGSPSTLSCTVFWRLRGPINFVFPSVGTQQSSLRNKTSNPRNNSHSPSLTQESLLPE